MEFIRCPHCEQTFPKESYRDHLQKCRGQFQRSIKQILRVFQDFAALFHECDSKLCVSCPFCEKDLPVLQLSPCLTLIHPCNYEALKKRAMTIQIRHAQLYHEKTPEEVRDAIKKWQKETSAYNRGASRESNH